MCMRPRKDIVGHEIAPLSAMKTCTFERMSELTAQRNWPDEFDLCGPEGRLWELAVDKRAAIVDNGV